MSGSSLRLGDEIDLVQHQDHRRLHVLEHVEQIAIARSRLHRRVHDERQHIHVAHRLERGVHHAHVQPMRRLVHAGRVHEHDLARRG